MTTIAIIPARGGSKRIPNKNIKKFLGKPIMAYTIEAAMASEVFDRVIVSTDSEKIAATAVAYGAEVPFRRPSELSDDFTPTAPVLIHALKWLMEHQASAAFACCIYATAPFVQADAIRKGYRLLTQRNVSTVFSVTTFAFPIFRALRINPAGSLEMFWPEYEMTRSNDLEEAYHDAGQFYWVNVAEFFKTQKLYGPDALPVVLPRYLVQDIDTPEDWQTAERMYQALNLGGRQFSR
jgi:pseudaminic acid cytidylyltransferase